MPDEQDRALIADNLPLIRTFYDCYVNASTMEVHYLWAAYAAYGTEAVSVKLATLAIHPYLLLSSVDESAVSQLVNDAPRFFIVVGLARRLAANIIPRNAIPSKEIVEAALRLRIAENDRLSLR